MNHRQIRKDIVSSPPVPSPFREKLRMRALSPTLSQWERGLQVSNA